MSNDAVQATKERIEKLIHIAAGGKISKEELTRHDVDLRLIGLDSLGYLNLLEGLERAFGVAIDLDEEDDHSFLHTINNIAHYVIENGQVR